MDTNFIGIEQYHHFSLGRIALTRGLITSQQVLESIKIQHNEPSQKIGDIFVKIQAVTNFQLQELVAFQKKVLSKILIWKYLPDSILKGYVYFNPGSDCQITTTQIKKTEEIEYQQFLTTNTVVPLAKILMEQESSLAEEMEKLFKSMTLFFMECPGCHRIYRLFHTQESSSSLVCPVCWTSELALKEAGQPLTQVNIASLQSSFSREMSCDLKALENPVEKIIIPHQSPGFVLAYETLKRIEPDHREGMTRKFSADHRTIKLVFGDMASQFWEHPPQKETAKQENMAPPQPIESQEKENSDNIKPAEDASPHGEIEPNLDAVLEENEYMGHRIDKPFQESSKTKMRVITKKEFEQRVTTAKAKTEPKKRTVSRKLVFFLCILCILSYGLWKLAFPSRVSTITPPVSNTTIVQPSSVSVAPKPPVTTNGVSDTPKEIEATPSKSASISLDGVATQRLKAIMPKIVMLAALLEKDIQSFLEKKDWKAYKNSYVSWQDMCKHYIAKKMPKKDGNYTSAIMRDKVYQIHELQQKLEQVSGILFQYLEANYSQNEKNKPMEASLLELMKNAKVYNTIMEVRTLFSEVSGSDLSIFTAFFKK